MKLYTFLYWNKFFIRSKRFLPTRGILTIDFSRVLGIRSKWHFFLMFPHYKLTYVFSFPHRCAHPDFLLAYSFPIWHFFYGGEFIRTSEGLPLSHSNLCRFHRNGCLLLWGSCSFFSKELPYCSHTFFLTYTLSIHPMRCFRSTFFLVICRETPWIFLFCWTDYPHLSCLYSHSMRS